MSKQQYIDELFQSMNQLRKLFKSQTQESHEDKVATMMQYSTLAFLKQHKNVPMREVASEFSLSKSSATQLVERLVNAGFVNRINDQDDRRIVRLTITSEGEQHLRDMKKRFRNKMEKILSKIPEQDLKELVRIHTELIETLQKEQNT